MLNSIKLHRYVVLNSYKMFNLFVTDLNCSRKSNLLKIVIHSGAFDSLTQSNPRQTKVQLSHGTKQYNLTYFGTRQLYFQYTQSSLVPKHTIWCRGHQTSLNSEHTRGSNGNFIKLIHSAENKVLKRLFTLVPKLFRVRLGELVQVR